MREFPPRVLAATDGSENAALAVRAAADICKETGSQLHLVHVWRRNPSTRFGLFVKEHLRWDARWVLNEQAAKVEGAKGVACATHLREGRAAEEILDLTKEIDAGLVVVGSRGLGPVGGLFLGSVSDEVVRRASRPVLVINGEEDAWPPRRVIFANDSSEEAVEAGARAAAIGELFGARGTVVRACPESTDTAEEERASFEALLVDEMRQEQVGLFGRASDLKEALGNPVKIRLAQDGAATAILEAAREGGESAALIAMGSRGLGIVSRARLGSVATKVKTNARGSVLVCPPLDREG